MQELIQAEIAETAREVAEKCGRKPCVSRQCAPALFKASDEDDEDDASFNVMLPHEDFDTCDPVSWWVGRRSQFPDLFVFARDLLAIPG